MDHFLEREKSKVYFKIQNHIILMKALLSYPDFISSQYPPVRLETETDYKENDANLHLGLISQHPSSQSCLNFFAYNFTILFSPLFRWYFSKYHI